MKVKEIQKTANIAWSPAEQHPIYIAAGTAAQQLDASFSTAAAVEIYAPNFSDHSQDVVLCGSIESDVRFHKLIWSPHGMGENHANGILAGGSDGGRFQIWSPEKIMSQEPARLFESTKHVGPVQAIDFNPFQANLIATGASDSDIYIWDFNKPDSPMTPGTKSQPSDDVSCVAWNRQVQHIMASTFSNRCIVWDLRKSEPIIKITESMSRIKPKMVCWHPDIATQMVLTSEDDHIPVIQLWDLRFATSPLKVLENHTRGVLSLSWCNEDPELLLSCGKDNRILCWSATSAAPNGEVIFELPTSNQWSYDVQWCPRNPCIISSCAFDGHISIYNILGGESAEAISSKVVESFPQQAPVSAQDFFNQANVQQQIQHQQHTSSAAIRIPLQKPPKWLRRPVGARFGFGGKLVTFEPSQDHRMVTVSQVCTEAGFLGKSMHFEAALSQNQILEFCEVKADGKEDLNVWKFLKTKFEEEPRQKFLKLLGHSGDNVAAKIREVIGDSRPASRQGLVNGIDKGLDDLNLQQQDDFELIADSAQHTLASEGEPIKIQTTDDVDGLINLAILTGRLDDGVKICCHSERWSEALILAAAGGPELLASTQRKYLKATNKSRDLISCLVNGNLDVLVESCDLESWKEVLSVILTYAPVDAFNSLCDQLGQRMESSSEYALYAPLCYICAGSIDRVIRIWAKTNLEEAGPEQLEELIERVMVLRKSTESAACDLSLLAETMQSYAELLASQGSLQSAINYLQQCSGEKTQVLSDRLYRALGHKSTAPFNTQRMAAQQAPRQRVNSGSAFQPARPGFSTAYQQPQVSQYQPYQPLNFQPQPQTFQPQPQTFQPQPQTFQPQPYSQPSYNPPPTPPYNQPNQPAFQAPPTSYYANQPLQSQPQTATQTTPSSYHSFQQSKPTSAWNDPPPISSKKATTSKSSATNLSTPIYNPATAYHDQAPPGAPAMPQNYYQPHQQQQQQHPGGQPMQNPAMQYQQPAPQTPPPAQMYQPQPQIPVHKPAPEKTAPVIKAEVPVEHQILQTTFNSLAIRCSQIAMNPHMKRKLDDVLKKLENLYDRLRASQLSDTALQGLHQIVQYIQMGDYDSALQVHTMMITQGNFTEISSFMPGVKVLVQIASQHRVMIQ